MGSGIPVGSERSAFDIEAARGRLVDLERRIRDAARADALDTSVIDALHQHQAELLAQSAALREAYSALEASRRYVDLYERAPFAYCTIDPRGVVLDVNARAVELLGRARDELVGSSLAAAIAFEQPRSVREYLSAAPSPAARLVAELRFERDGAVVEVRAASVAILDAEGECVARRVALFDITQERSAERALARAHEEERRLRARSEAIERASLTISQAMLRAPADGAAEVLAVIAGAARSLCGADYAALVIRVWEASPLFVATDLPPADAARMERAARAIDGAWPERARASRGADLRAALPSGVLEEPLPLPSFLAVPVGGSERRGTLLLAAEPGRELDEEDEAAVLLLAERAAIAMELVRLRQVEARERRRLEVLARAMAAMTESTDHRTALRTMARAMVPALADACRIDALSADGARLEAVAIAVDGDEEIAPTELAPLREGPLFEALAAGRPARVDGGEHAHGFGPRLAVRSSLAIPLIVGARTIGALRLAAAERPAIDEGDAVIVEIAQHAAILLENARLYAAAEAAVRVRDETLGVVAHDLRSPLSGIRAAAASLAAMPEEQREWGTVDAVASMMQGALDHTDRLIRELLDVTRIEAGHVWLEREAVDPRALVAQAIELHAPEARRRGVSLVARLGDALPSVDGDRTRLLQVLGNLLSNALALTSAGDAVRVDVEAEGDALSFSVRDTGPGIAADHLPHVFDRFWRARRGDPSGAGLGLAIAKGLVEAHGGRIWAESPEAGGCVFRFTVPLARDAR